MPVSASKKSRIPDLLRIPETDWLLACVIQLFDVFFFRVLKDFTRRDHNHNMIHECDVRIHIRHSILLILEVSRNQFCNPIFQPLLQYSWRKIGYVNSEPVEFLTPIEHCMQVYRVKQCFCGDCRMEVPFITCSYCLKSLCFSHFIITKHLHSD